MCRYYSIIYFQEKQRLVYLNNAWPKAMFDILCDFALAEKNYYDTNFEPAKIKMVERKENEVLIYL